MYKIYLRTVTQTCTEANHIEDQKTTFKSFRSKEKAEKLISKLKDHANMLSDTNNKIMYYVIKEA